MVYRSNPAVMVVKHEEVVIVVRTVEHDAAELAPGMPHTEYSGTVVVTTIPWTLKLSPGAIAEVVGEKVKLLDGDVASYALGVIAL